MNKKEFRKYLDRDGHCLHCGIIDDTLVPQHRQSRQMGGNRGLDKPSNIVVMCSLFNGLIESSSEAAEFARANGWKLERWQSPEESPVYDRVLGKWSILNNCYEKATFS